MGLKNAHKYICKLSAIALAVSISLSTSVFADYRGVTLDYDINVQAENSKNSDVIGKLAANELLAISGLSGNYFKVNYDAKDAYIQKDLIAITEAEGIITEDGVNVRNRSDKEGDILGQLNLGAKLTITGQNNDFLLVNYKGGKAFVHKDYIDCDVEDYLTGVSNSSAVLVYGLVNSSSGLNIRTGPSTSTDVVTFLNNDYPLDIIEVSGDWVLVKTYDDKIGYASSEFIEFVEGVKPEKPPASSKALEIVNFSKQFLGTPYVWGGTNLRSGVDCSGFVYSLYKNFGYTLSRTATPMLSDGVRVAKADLQPADLVFFSNDGYTGIQHVGMYIGDGQFIHSSSGRAMKVIISSMSDSYYVRNYINACRILR